jgi:ribosome-binding protein aMBF1 (putative translation factor)
VPTVGHNDVVARRKAALSPAGRVQVEVFKDAFSVGAQLARRRHELNLTQADLSQRSGVQQADVSRIERGVVVPSMSTVQRLADALGARWVLVGAESEASQSTKVSSVA